MKSCKNTFKPKPRKRRRKSEINMMTSVDDFQDMGFSKRDVAVRVDVPLSQSKGKYEGNPKST